MGKSHIIAEYGKSEFENFVELNLELSPNLLACFKSLDVETICRELEALTKSKFINGKSLLFIDEIQESADAILSLRAFKEKRPGLEVIAAGSLLEFVLDDEIIRSFPVGRVAFTWMHPMTFFEFLLALDESRLADLIKDIQVNGRKPLSSAIHNRLLTLVREYFVVGGMPEVVEHYRESKSYLDAKRVQNRISRGYIADFVKYGARYDHRKLSTILSSVPRLIGKPLKYNAIDPTSKARDLKKPLLDLEKAGLLHLIRASSSNGVPIGSEEREGIFKVQFLDIGLMLNMLGLELGSMPIEQALFANEGALAEQFVGQELLGNDSCESSPQLFYWQREAKGSEAEVDFVIPYKDLVIPVEVKSGATGTLKSARLFQAEKKSPLILRISQHELSMHDGVLSVPFYMCSELPRLLHQVLG